MDYNSHHFVINQRFTIIPKEIGFYHAFPTLIKAANNFILAFRSGRVDRDNMHGSNGKVSFFYSNISEIDSWKEINFSLNPDGNGYNEMDAIISYPNKSDIFLVTRNYDSDGVCRTWLSKFKSEILFEILNSENEPLEPNKECKSISYDLISNISPKPILCKKISIERHHLKKISNAEINSFGHIVQTLSGELLMSGYIASPVVLSSNDEGSSWNLKSEIYDNSNKNFSLSEFSLAHISDTEWIGLMRDEIEPNNILLISSKDDCKTWMPFFKTNLTGHAPMVLKTIEGGYICIYRDLGSMKISDNKKISKEGFLDINCDSEDIDKRVSVGFSSDGLSGWNRIGTLNSYSGSLYDGGYGDIVELDKNRFLAVYYLCDNDNSPWIEGSIFSYSFR